MGQSVGALPRESREGHTKAGSGCQASSRACGSHRRDAREANAVGAGRARERLFVGARTSLPEQLGLRATIGGRDLEAARPARARVALNHPGRRREGISRVDVDVVVDVIVDGDGDGDDSAAKLGQHGDHASQELDSLALFALIDNAEDVESVDDCGAFHG